MSISRCGNGLLNGSHASWYLRPTASHRLKYLALSAPSSSLVQGRQRPRWKCLRERRGKERGVTKRKDLDEEEREMHGCVFHLCPSPATFPRFYFVSYHSRLLQKKTLPSSHLISSSSSYLSSPPSFPSSSMLPSSPPGFPTLPFPSSSSPSVQIICALCPSLAVIAVVVFDSTSNRS